MYYPIFLDLRHTRCLVVGGGEVGLRKARGLLQASPAEVLVLDVAPFAPEWDTLACPALRLEQRLFTPEDVQDMGLVFACTGARAVNAQVTEACTAAKIWCNCVDAPLEGNCIVPAVARAEGGELMAALSTGGASPAWARILREELEDWLRPRNTMNALLGRVRPLVLALGDKTGHNTQLFRSLARSELRHWLTVRDRAKCEILLKELLPDALHPHIAEILHDLV